MSVGELCGDAEAEKRGELELFAKELPLRKELQVQWPPPSAAVGWLNIKSQAEVLLFRSAHGGTPTDTPTPQIRPSPPSGCHYHARPIPSRADYTVAVQTHTSTRKRAGKV